MPNFFQKLKHNLSSSNSNKNNASANSNLPSSNDAKKNETKTLNNRPKSVIDPKLKIEDSKLTENKTNNNNKNNLNLLSLIIDSSVLVEENNKIEPSEINKTASNDEHHIAIFDPDDYPEESETFNHSIVSFKPNSFLNKLGIFNDSFFCFKFLDDRSFMVDDDNEEDLHMDNNDKEVAQLNNQKINEFLKDNNCYTINEIPETSSNKSYRLGSSRASSRSSLGSESIKTNSSDHLSSGLGDNVNNKYKRSNSNNKMNKSDSFDDSEESLNSSCEQVIKNGSKNALLDALMRKYNVTSELDNDLNSSKSVDQTLETNTNKDKECSTISKQVTRYIGDDQKRKQSELEKKINKLNAEKQHQTNLSVNKLSNDQNNLIENSSSFDDDPKSLKIVRSTGTQMSTFSSSSSSSIKLSSKKKLKSISIHRLPQNFECKYLGKTKCKGLWGLKNIREPVDRLIRNAKRHQSLKELPDVEALISEKGIYIIQAASPEVQNLKGKFLKAVYYQLAISPTLYRTMFMEKFFLV